MNTNIIYNEDCKTTMSEHIDRNSVDIILTSPPYNTGRNNCDFHNDTRKGRYTVRYVDFNDNKTPEEYSQWTIDMFNEFDKVLKENGVILYNMCYGKHTHESFWHLISQIQIGTNFTVADCIVWKKKTAVPNTASPNKLTRICEFVFVFVRKNEYDTFTANKKIISFSRGTNQKNYENVYNYIEAKNNDGPCSIHKATYSTEFCEKLLKIYGRDGFIVYDPFIGTGTTALAARNLNMDYIGSEIYEDYYNLTLKRLEE
jgi:DNA modification methylase